MSWDAPLIEQMDQRRLHLRHGPIDLIVNTHSGMDAVRSKLEYVFPTVLPELCQELIQLRRPVGDTEFEGPVAQIASAAVRPFHDQFVTPMAAIAGSVAQYLLDQVQGLPETSGIWINNGGDIAMHLTAAARIGICNDIQTQDITAHLDLKPEDNLHGVATSGWKGRSYSLGIADAVTVIAHTAAKADVAATLIANAVMVPSVNIIQAPANTLEPDSDLGAKLVTVEVPTLSQEERVAALDAGRQRAQDYIERSLIAACYLSLQGDTHIVGSIAERAAA